VPESLPVDLNRDEIHSLSVPPEFEAEGSFDVVLANHGESVHVHLHLDDDLSAVATLDANNHYVEGETERRVRVVVDGRGTVRGRLKVVTSYGAKTRYVDVSLIEPSEETDPVEVDESLARPAPKEPDRGLLPVLRERLSVPVLGLAGLAVGIALVAALTVESTVVLVGAAVVVLGALAAMAVLLFG
jgi:hypothetical protein